MKKLGLAPGDEFRVDTAGKRIVLGREQDTAERRLMAIREFAGSLPGVYEPGYLDELRGEWR